MKTKQNFLIYTLLLMAFFLVFASNCKKDENIPVLTTTSVTNITATTATSGGNITSDGGSTVIARGVCWSTEDAPTISDNKTISGANVGVFTSSLSGLSPETKYYVRAYATNSNGTAYGSSVSFSTQKVNSPASFTDARDGTVYKTVVIGSQVWMAENLKYLPSVVGPSTGSGTSPYYYVYDYSGGTVASAKATAIYTTYGVLYNWPAAMGGAKSSTANPSGVQGVCPAGWHIPSDAEWKQLTNYLSSDYAAIKLKEAGTVHWASPNTEANNSTGFTALPGGMRRGDSGIFRHMDANGVWWSSTEYNYSNAISKVMDCYATCVFEDDHKKDYGFSVRCVKD